MAPRPALVASSPVGPAAIVLALLLPEAAAAERLLCLGLAPGFMMTLEDETARFDYLGDGVFDLAPPLALPERGVARHEIETYGGPLPVFVERAACPILGTELAFRVEIGVQTSQGMRPMTGCCREAR
jgi:hypothetical protein